MNREFVVFDPTEDGSVRFADVQRIVVCATSSKDVLLIRVRVAETAWHSYAEAMSERIIRKRNALVMALAVGACDGSRHGNLLDGCYYLGGEPILTLQGTEGYLRIPGDISHFRLIPHGSSDYIWMTTQPGFVIGGSDQKLVRSTGSSSSPMIIIEDENAAASRMLVRDDGEIKRLVHKNSCDEILPPQQ